MNVLVLHRHQRVLLYSGMVRNCAPIQVAVNTHQLRIVNLLSRFFTKLQAMEYLFKEAGSSPYLFKEARSPPPHTFSRRPGLGLEAGEEG